jgi:hypothetical protein
MQRSNIKTDQSILKDASQEAFRSERSGKDWRRIESHDMKTRSGIACMNKSNSLQ